MKKNAFLVRVSLISMIGIALTSCGNTSSLVSSAASGSSSSGDESSSETSSETVLTQATGYDSSDSYANMIKTGLTDGVTGAYSYVGSDYATRRGVLGKLEKYAVDTSLTGLPLWSNSAYVKYSSRVSFPYSDYITGYGFSILRDGTLTSDMPAANESTAAYRGYLHGWDSSDPGTINALNSDNSQVSDMFSNISSAYFSTKANAAHDGYDWYGCLSSKDRPSLIKDDGTVNDSPSSTDLSTKWRVYLRTGEAGGVDYKTNSTMSDRAAYNGTYASIDDYVNAWKVLLNQKNNYYRGGELASQTGKQSIVGAQAYYNATADGDTSEDAVAAWENVGIKSGTDATNGDYIDFTFGAPCNRFYAMYNLSEGNYEPIPKSFFELVGATNYGGYSSDKNTTPVDNILSVGPYTLESWEESKAITYKRNADWYEIKSNPNLYRIPGIHTAILSGYNTDNTVPFQQYLIGNLDSASIPTKFISKYKDDTNNGVTKSVPGDSVFKLNLNTCDTDTWDELFGANGSITQTSASDAWDVKPWMSNDNFVKGLFYSIDRATAASKRGYTGTVDYFSDNYLSNPEEGESYDSTADHKAALTDFWGDTLSTTGFDLGLSSAAFDTAVTQLKEAGKIADTGTAANPTEISIDIWWMYESQINDYGKEISKYIEDAFNANTVNNGVKLTVNNQAVSTWSDVYYKHLMVGQFDLGFGSISGNTLDPLNFLEVLKSNNSSGFTLNWGKDTSELSDKLDYDGKKWSFDTLWKAGDSGVIAAKGIELPPVIVKYGTGSFTNGSLTCEMSYLLATGDNTLGIDWTADGNKDVKIEVVDISIYNATGSAGVSLEDLIDNELAEWDTDAGTFSFTLPQSTANALLTKYGYYIVEATYNLTIAGVSTSGVVDSQIVVQ